MYNHHPDFSSSDDEFDDDFEFQEMMRERRKNRTIHNVELTEAQKKEYRLKNLYLHLMNGKVEEVCQELDNGLDVNQKLQNDWTPLLVAASTANYALVKELHKRGADVKLTRDGHTALMLTCNCPENTASFEESSKVAELLLDLGVNPNAINRKRMNALMFAAGNGNLEAVKLLCPVTDCKAEDNQNWNALFWAVTSGRVIVVQYFIDKGLPFNKEDVRGSTPLDIARENDLNEIIELFSPEEDIEDFVVDNYQNDFESTFQDLKQRQKPQFFLDICKMLHGMRCENLIKLLADKEVSLFDFLSSSEKDFKKLGVEMPFQRKRLMTGIYRFHKNPYHPKSLPTVGKKDLYSNMDVAAAILSTVKQIIAMEASLKYVRKNFGDDKLFIGNKEIEKAIRDIEKKLKKLKDVTRHLGVKAEHWDSKIAPMNIITSRSGKRWFPWRKTMLTVGIVIVLGIKLWNKPFRFSI